LKNVKPFNIKTELEVIQFLENSNQKLLKKKPGGLSPDLIFTIKDLEQEVQVLRMQNQYPAEIV
jgi:hypothetical protein